jgi:hypothetical protein
MTSYSISAGRVVPQTIRTFDFAAGVILALVSLAGLPGAELVD